MYLITIKQKPNMNISKPEQRTLHALAKGGHIKFSRNQSGKVSLVECYTSEGYILSNCTITVFTKLKNKRLIKSQNSAPYKITKAGLKAVRPQLDNR